MKTAIYTRYSTDKQDAASLEGQERVCRAHVERLGYQVVAVYSDAAISGTTLARPGLQQLLTDAASKRFRALVVSDLSRLSRDRLDSGNLIRRLSDIGVRVLDVKTVTDSNDDSADVIHAIDGIVAGEYVKAVRIATHRQLQTRALAGFNPGGKAYGYTSIEEPNAADATKPRHKSVIAPKEAEIVRRIFASTLAGKSPRDVAYALNADGVPAPHDGGKGFKGARGWGHTTIRAMLLSRRYLGEVVWNEYRWKKTADGKRKRFRRPDAEHVRRHDPSLAIIDAETFDAVGKSHVRRGTRETPVVRARHMLSGLLTCGLCGGTFGVVHSRRVGDTVHRTLGCVSYRDRGGAICTNAKTISDRKIIKALGSHLRDRLSRPDRVKKFVETFQDQYAALEAKGEDPTATLQTKIDRAKQSVDAVMSALLAVPGSRALGDKLAAEETALLGLQDQLQNLKPARPRVIPHPAAVAAYVAKLADVLEAGDLVRAGDILRSALAPFAMFPEAEGYRLKGALNLGLSVSSSSGGVLRDVTDNWMPVELAAA